MDFKVVLKGIDSLYLSYRGAIKPDLLDDLESRKQKARSDDVGDKADAVMILGNHRFEVLPKGSGVFSYVIADNWFRIAIAGAGSKKLPALYVQVRSQLLNCYGLDESMNNLRLVIAELLSITNEEHISRVDIFIDYITDFNFNSIVWESWITQAKQKNQYRNGGDFTGWAIGRRSGDICARLYDKTAEIIVSDKNFFKDLWFQSGWQQDQRVVRLEFALKNNLLKLLGVASISDLTEKQNDLWRYCTEEWLRLAIIDNTENRTRLETEPLWSEIQRVKFNDCVGTAIRGKVSRSRSPNMKRLYVGWLNLLISYSALNGYDSSDLPAASRNLLRDAVTYMDACVLNDDKAKKNFADSIDYVTKKINLKKKEFNKSGGDDVPF